MYECMCVCVGVCVCVCTYVCVCISVCICVCMDVCVSVNGWWWCVVRVVCVCYVGLEVRVCVMRSPKLLERVNVVRMVGLLMGVDVG